MSVDSKNCVQSLKVFLLRNHPRKHFTIFCCEANNLRPSGFIGFNAWLLFLYYKINDWNYQIDMLLPKMSRHYVDARHVFSTNEQQKDCWQPK